ncbi:MAG: hypothetical protein L0Y48_05500 [Fusobacteria bacterium]|nr:hypothetical protein [Fusobacteriota bacterium]
MAIVILVLIILVLVISLGELNQILINLNLYGLVIKNVPFSIIMAIFLAIGCVLGVMTMLAKYNLLKKQFNSLLDRYESENKTADDN